MSMDASTVKQLIKTELIALVNNLQSQGIINATIQNNLITAINNT